jgi:hypothetical protein
MALVVVERGAVLARVTAMVEPRHAASITSADRSLKRS